MSEAIFDLLWGTLAEGRTVFVFPSQLAADAWAAECLRRSGAAALDPARFIGWDRFKEGELSPHRKEKPANRVTRTIWAAGLLASRKGRTGYEALLGAGELSPAFVPFLASMPPSLAAIRDALLASPLSKRSPPDPTVTDLLRLYENYRGFLERKSLFEPGWEGGQTPRLGDRHLIIAPELIEDFQNYSACLAGLPEVSLFRLPPAPAAHVRPLEFRNVWEELHSVFLRVGALLDAGTAPEDIGITVSNLDEARPWIEAAARDSGVPIVIRRGRALSDSPYGRLLSEIGKAVSTGYSLPAMEALIRDSFLTWKEPALAEGLIRFGEKYQAYASYTREGRTVDIWLETFDRCESVPILESFYRQLRKSLGAMAEAPDFAALGKAITAFRSQFLIDSAWSESERRVVERSMAELEALATAEATYADGVRLPSPFGLFRATLDSETYVPQVRGGFVPIFPWRVSALLPFRYHFLLGCGQEAVEVRYGSWPFLRDDLREGIGAGAHDATSDFLTAYLHSGQTVVPCHAESELSGWSAAHPFFGFGTSQDALLAEAPEEPASPQASEAQAWKTGLVPQMPSRLLWAQIAGFKRALSIGPGQPDAFKELGGTSRRLILEKSSTAAGKLRLSSTIVDGYRDCPFRWLLSVGLRIEETSVGLEFFDDRLAGTMAHKAIEWLSGCMRELGPIDPTHTAAYIAMAEEAPLAVLPVFVKKYGAFLEPMFSAWAPVLASRLKLLVARLLEDPGWELGGLELTLSSDLPELDAVLEGRLDRLGHRGPEFAIVDYKKKNLPKKKELLVAAGA
ncbi:MAG: PD-(D/E)XK nuclease family protein [Spirochaetota bacterium]